MEAAGMEVHHHPFMDGLTPPVSAMVSIVEELLAALQSGKKPLVQYVCTLLLLRY